jgi:hypothetical protein
MPPHLIICLFALRVVMKGGGGFDLYEEDRIPLDLGDKNRSEPQAGVLTALRFVLRNDPENKL